MPGRSASLVGREAELERLGEALERARARRAAAIVLRQRRGRRRQDAAVAELAARAADALVLRGAAGQGGTAPYGPVVAALRSQPARRARRARRAAARCAPHLALLLPELGEPAAARDRATLVRGACAARSRSSPPTARRSSSSTTCSGPTRRRSSCSRRSPSRCGELPVLVVAAYRSDGLPRDHGCAGCATSCAARAALDELALEPLDARRRAALLAPALRRAARRRRSCARSTTARRASPFFVEELAAALRVSGALQRGPRGPRARRRRRGPGARHGPRRGPDQRVRARPRRARAAAEAAAVAGETFDLDARRRAGERRAALAELLEHGLRARAGRRARRAFRHALAREALYADVPWMRRRALHRRARRGARGRRRAEPRGRHPLARRARRRRARATRCCARPPSPRRVHAYRDARRGRPPGARAVARGRRRGPPRSTTLERYARCAELAGELAEAARAWRELRRRPRRRRARGSRRAAPARRGLRAARRARAGVRRAPARRRGASRPTARPPTPRSSGSRWPTSCASRRAHGEAIELAQRARAPRPSAAGRLDLRLRALGLEGVARAKRGDYEAGLETVRGGARARARARPHRRSPPSSTSGSASSLYDVGRLPPRRGGARHRARASADASPDAGTEVACVTCLVYVLRERGEWARAAEMGRELIAERHGGLGRRGPARRDPRLRGQARLGAAAADARALAVAPRVGHYNMTVDSTAALARVAAAEGDDDEAAEHCRALLDALGGQRGPPLRGRGAALGARRSSRAAATAPARTPAPRR